MIRLVDDYEEADIIKARQRIKENSSPSDWEIDFFIDVHPFLTPDFRSFSQYGITSDYERIKPDFDKIQIKIKSLEEFTSLVEDFSTYMEWLKADGQNIYYWDKDMEMLVRDFVTTFLSLQEGDNVFNKQLECKILERFIAKEIWVIEYKNWRNTIEEITDRLYAEGHIEKKLNLPTSSAKILLMKTLKDCRLNLHDHTKPLYKYLTADAAKQVLSNATFKYSSPLAFNDPFDFNAGLIKFSLANKAALIEKVKEGFAAAGLNDVSWLRNLVAENIMEEFNEDFRRLLDLHKKNSRVLCLSETNSETLMWSHYAAGHSGICLGIKVPPMNNIWNGETLKVAYIKKQEVRSFSVDDEVEKRKALLRWCFIKSKHWAYEKEVRIHFQHRKTIQLFEKLLPNESLADEMMTFVPFAPEQLCEVYYGVSCLQKDILDIEEILKLKGYNVKRARMQKERNSFNLKVNYL